MLERLNIRGYAIIDSLEIEFHDGLTILSGETGAGKSILIGALSLVLGGKGAPSAVRSGLEEAEVSGVIRVEDSTDATAWLELHEITPEDGRVIVRRILKQTGRGSIFLQSTPVTRGDLRELTSLLFDMHGQHEHQSLLKKSTHRTMIDRFGRLESEVESFSALFHSLSSMRSDLAKVVEGDRDREVERERLEIAVAEISGAELDATEEPALEKEQSMLTQSERLIALMNEVHDTFAENRGGALSILRSGLERVAEIATIVEELRPLGARLESAFFEIEDISETVRGYQNQIDFSPERLEECERRLAEIRRLKKKYGGSIPDVIRYFEDATARAAAIESQRTDEAAIREEIERLELRLRDAAAALSNRRRVAAQSLQGEIETHLQRLGMAKSEFSIAMDRREGEHGQPVFTQSGIDSPEFLISPNAGEPIRPLRETASGGEMSRIMLAIKTVLAESDFTETLVFDEIDAGIGGQVAVDVGEHLSRLGSKKQVLCITHLPTIAVRADQHYVVDKQVRDGRTVTVVTHVSGEDRVTEIARMLSGDSDADTSRSHARELLAQSSRSE